MLDFRAWLEAAETGVQYSDPVNNDRYAEKGARSKWKGGTAPAMPGPFNVDPDAMYLGNGKRSKKRNSRPK